MKKEWDELKLLAVGGGEDGCDRVLEGRSAVGDEDGKVKGPSKAVAGDGEREPGIGERGLRGTIGEERRTVSRN